MFCCLCCPEYWPTILNLMLKSSNTRHSFYNPIANIQYTYNSSFRCISACNNEVCMTKNSNSIPHKGRGREKKNGENETQRARETAPKWNNKIGPRVRYFRIFLCSKWFSDCRFIILNIMHGCSYFFYFNLFHSILSFFFWIQQAATN